MFNLNEIVRDNIRTLTPYSSARDEFMDNGAVFLDANENPFGTYNRYPDPNQLELKQLISETKAVPTNNVFLGNGSDEIIDLLFKAFCNPRKDKAVQCGPTYGMYAVSAAINDVELINWPLNNSFQLDIEGTSSILQNPRIKLIFICSPNNPTGNLIHPASIDFILRNFRGLVVIDEAYVDFSLQESWSKRIEEFPNLVVLQTLSKAWGLAGIRIGMAFSDVAVVQYLNKVKPPYNISTLNQKAAVQSLKNPRKFEQNVQVILSEKERVHQELTKLKLVETIYPSAANFLLVQVSDACTIYDRLIDQKLVVRNRHQLLLNCLRITIGSPEENELLLKELKNIDDEKDAIY